MQGTALRLTAVAYLIALGGCAPAARLSGAAAGPPDDLALFRERVDAYAQLSRRLAAKQGNLPRKATPEAIASHQGRLAAALRAQRAQARPGDLLTPPAAARICAEVRRGLRGKYGQDQRLAIAEDNPGKTPLAVNADYPEGLPVATLPPQLLAGMPALPEEVGYRFLGSSLILLDLRASLIADFARDCLQATVATTPAGKARP